VEAPDQEVRSSNLAGEKNIIGCFLEDVHGYSFRACYKRIVDEE